MELMQLEVFVAVVEERSFLRAAERVLRTQPAVSLGIRKLEGKVGVSLFDRSNRRGGRPTPAGERLYEYTRKMLDLRDDGRRFEYLWKAADWCRRRRGLRPVPFLTKKFRGACPSVELRISLDTLTNVLEEIAEDRLDVALISGRPRSDAHSMNLAVTSVLGMAVQRWLWVVRQRRGSQAALAFERNLLESLGVPRGKYKTKKVGLREVPARKACLREGRVATDGGRQ